MLFTLCFRSQKGTTEMVFLHANINNLLPSANPKPQITRSLTYSLAHNSQRTNDFIAQPNKIFSLHFSKRSKTEHTQKKMFLW